MLPKCLSYCFSSGPHGASPAGFTSSHTFTGESDNYDALDMDTDISSDSDSTADTEQSNTSDDHVVPDELISTADSRAASSKRTQYPTVALRGGTLLPRCVSATKWVHASMELGK